MAEEYIYERERELLDYFRNNLADPSIRGTDVLNESHIATAGQTDFILTNVLVKNISEEITLDGARLRKGYNFNITYGEGNDSTMIILKTPATLGDELLISYHYGPSMIEREFSRTDVLLPRVVMMFLTGSEEFAALGDIMEYGKGSYFNVSYRFEIRSRFATQARILASQAFNLGRKLRQLNLFRTNIARSYDLQNFDYDRDKEAYIWQFSVDVQWEIMYE